MAKQKLRKYELIYIVQPEATEEERERVSSRIDAVVDQFEARVLKREDWGKRKLAYEIRKFNKGFYSYAVLLGRPGLTQEIERVLRMIDSVIRFITIKLEDGIDPDAEIVIDDSPAVREHKALDFDEEMDDDA